MEHIYYGIAIIVYGVFIIRFILSWICGDFEIDADADLDLGDIVSFKGFIHFLMGVSGWLSVKSLITHTIIWYDWIIALVVGIIFVTVLFYLYKFMYKLEHKPIILSGKDLIGKEAKIYINCGYNEYYYKFIITVNNGNGTVEVNAKSQRFFKVGDMVTINNYDGAYYIIN